MSAIPAVVIGSAPVRPAAHEAAESAFATRTRAFTPTACACRPSRNANSNDDSIGYRLSAIGYRLLAMVSRFSPAGNAPRRPESIRGARRRGVQGERQAGFRFALSEPNSTRAAPCGRRTPADAWSGAYARAVICYGSRTSCCSENTARTRLHLANTDHLPPGVMVFEYIIRHSLAHAGFASESRNRTRIGAAMTDAHGW
jgi:hypothetical protein